MFYSSFKNLWCNVSFTFYWRSVYAFSDLNFRSVNIINDCNQNVLNTIFIQMDN